MMLIGQEPAAEAYYWIGLCDEAQGKVDQAISDFTKQISLFPASRRTPPAMLKLGERYQDKGQYDLALQQFTTVLASSPENAPRAQLLIGICYQVQKKYSEAIAALRKGIESFPTANGTVKEMKYRLGECYRESGRWDDGIALYKALAVDYPEDAARHKFDLGICYQGKGDYEQAITLYKEVSTGYPDSPKAKEALLRVDECLRAQGNYDEELAYLQKLYDEDAELRADAILRKAEVLDERLRDYGQAVAELQRLVAEHPGSPLAVEAQARIAAVTLYGLRDIARARLLLQDFIAEHPEYDGMIFVKEDLAYCSYAEAKYLEAAKLYQEAYECKDVGDGWRPSILYMIADCHMRANDVAKAKETLQKLMDTYGGSRWAGLAAAKYAALSDR